MRTLAPAQQPWIGRVFFVWVSVFNLFVISVFWAFMTDVFSTDQAKRLFGFIAVGGTLGGILGGTITASLVRHIGTANLLFVSAVMLEAGTWCVRFFPADFRQDRQLPATEIGAEKPVGGSLWAGITHVVRSPYLLGICGFILLHAITATLIYFQQADITAHQFSDRAARTAFFANLDRSVNTLTILGLLAVFQVLRRAADYAMARPAREVLYTVLRREDKYKAKSFIDTFVYRAGDQIGAWSYPLLTWLGLRLTGISFAAAPLAALWCALSLWLGRKQVVFARVQQHIGTSDISDIAAPLDKPSAA